MTKDEALDLALEFVEANHSGGPDAFELIAAIKQARSAPVQEPVAWQYRDANDDGTWSAWLGCDKRLTESTWREVRPLYTTPPAAQRKWVGLETNEVAECWHNDPYKFYRAIEAKLKEKNNG